ncbi:hypothetical protein SteCoe_29147 [Stentor coeruleus]|uniref:Uncharacterized protein n=1 Tax=Stentor coeruleus TaxID=5963 RepID=A0A1R2B6I2_9CILI|nr:hypothetical protein SteCoe_29147 [Stentor coeruleus]
MKEEPTDYYKGTDEINDDSIQDLMKKYDFSFKVSRGMFSEIETHKKPYKTLKHNPSDSCPLVYNRLFEDFTRRQEAKKRLTSIIEIKENEKWEAFLQASDVNKKNLSKSLSKPDISKTIQRLHSFWENKWLNIEKKKKLIQDMEDKEINELTKGNKANNKTDPESFKRLISPRKQKKSEQPELQTKKFSIHQAIESGKRLMNKKGTLTPSPTKLADNRSLQAEDLLGAIGKSGSPGKTSKPLGSRRNINLVLSKCKGNSLDINSIDVSPIKKTADSAIEIVAIGAGLIDFNEETLEKH